MPEKKAVERRDRQGGKEISKGRKEGRKLGEI